MIDLILNRKNIPYLIIAVLLIYISMINNSEPIEINIPSEKNTVEITDPIPEVRFDTTFVYRDSIREVINIKKIKNPLNEALLKDYEAAVKENDSLKQLQLFKEAITENTYTEVLKDSIQTVTVKSEVIGILKKQTISYDTKPKTIIVKARKIKPSIYLSGFTSSRIESFNLNSYGIKAQLINKKRAFGLGIDNNNNIYFELGIKLF